MDSFFASTGLDMGLYLGYLLMFAAVVAATAFPVVHAIKNPKEIAKSGMSALALLVVFGISYALAGAEITPKYEALGVNTEFSSKMIGAGLTMFYFALGISILGLIYSEISKAFK